MIRIGKFSLSREPGGVISEKGVWIAIWHSSDGCWMYCGCTLIGCLLDMVKNWKKDNSLAG